MKIWLILLLLLTFFSLVKPGESADFNSKTTFYQIRYSKPYQDGPAKLSCIFSSDITPKQTEEFLRIQLEQAVRYLKPTHDIMAYAWVRTPADKIEKSIDLPDGSSFLMFIAKTGNIETEKIYYEKKFAKADLSTAINVDFKLTVERNSEGMIRVSATTNLPDGIKLGLDIENPSIKYLDGGIITVKNHGFQSGWFSNNGKALPKGKYKISIMTGYLHNQPDSVIKIIGKDGENLAGNYVIIDSGVKMIRFNVTKQL